MTPWKSACDRFIYEEVGQLGVKQLSFWWEQIERVSLKGDVQGFVTNRRGSSWDLKFNRVDCLLSFFDIFFRVLGVEPILILLVLIPLALRLLQRMIRLGLSDDFCSVVGVVLTDAKRLSACLISHSINLLVHHAAVGICAQGKHLRLTADHISRELRHA